MMFVKIIALQFMHSDANPCISRKRILLYCSFFTCLNLDSDTQSFSSNDFQVEISGVIYDPKIRLFHPDSQIYVQKLFEFLVLNE